MRKIVWLSTAVALMAAGAGGSAAQDSSDSNRTAFLKEISRSQVPLNASVPKLSFESGYTQETVSLASSLGDRVPLLILRTGERPAKRAVVIVLHGTNQSKESMLPQLRAYADLGFISVGMDAPHHGERARPIPGLSDPYQSALLRAYRTGEGHPYLYDTVVDVMRLIDYLATRPDVDPARIGLWGFSKGGTEAYLAAAADTRIAVVAPVIGVQSFAWSLKHGFAWEARTWTLRRATEAAAADNNETISPTFLRKFYDRIAPGLVDRFDGPAMLPLIAPRPLLIVSGDSDPRSPLGGVREAVGAAERAYAAAGAKERVSFILETDAAHEVTPDATGAIRQWFVRWLSPEAN